MLNHYIYIYIQKVQFFLGFIHAYTITYVWSLDEFIMTSRRDLTGMMVSKRNHLHLFSGWWTIVIQPDIHIDIRMHIIYLSIYILYIHIFNFILVVYIYIHTHTYINIPEYHPSTCLSGLSPSHGQHGQILW